MDRPTGQLPEVIPAQLEYLSIYNPTIGSGEDAIKEQILFYTSRKLRAKYRGRGQSGAVLYDEHEEENEKLRQVGLAQGMIEFARAFADDKDEPLDSIETEKSRIVLQQLEDGWWLVAAIALTQLPYRDALSGRASSPKKGQNPNLPKVEYSNREVSSPLLLRMQIQRAHQIFLLHNGLSLQHLFETRTRPDFCKLLDRYWNRFAWSWDVLLHGNPAVEVYGGIKLAAGGELGVGVGEEERGSGEREVLEHFCVRTEGLRDVVIGRYDNLYKHQALNQSLQQRLLSPQRPSGPGPKSKMEPAIPRIERLSKPEITDGIVFSGVGTLGAESVRDLSAWMEDVSRYGAWTYGVHRKMPKAERPPVQIVRRRSGSRPNRSRSLSLQAAANRFAKRRGSNSSVEQKRLNIPPPIYSAVEIALERATQAAESRSNPSSKPKSPVKEKPLSPDDRQDRWGWADYFTLGYGKDWGGPGTEITDPKSPRDRGRTMTKETEMDSRRSGVKAPLSITVGVAAPIGRYQIGLMDDLDDDEEDVLRSPTSAQDEVNLEGPGRSAEPTISSKTVWISLKEPMHSEEDGTAPREAEYKQLLAAGRGKSTEYRVVLYTNPPFLFCFIFDASTESLSTPKIYRQIHHQIGTLQAPLLLSTDRTRSLAPFSNQSSPSKKRSSNPLYDFVYDPLTLHTICSIPNVPESPPAELPASRSTSQNRQTPWTRMEALNVHTQILQTVAQIRGQIGELERTCKTHRGWWIVWMALPVAVGADPLDNPKAAPIASSAASASSVPSQSVVSELSQDQIGTAEVKVVRREAFLVRKAGDDNRDKGKSSATQRISLLRLGRQESSELSDQSAVAGWTSGIGLDGRKYINDLLRLAFS